MNDSKRRQITQILFLSRWLLLLKALCLSKSASFFFLKSFPPRFLKIFREFLAIRDFYRRRDNRRVKLSANNSWSSVYSFILVDPLFCVCKQALFFAKVKNIEFSFYIKFQRFHSFVMYTVEEQKVVFNWNWENKTPSLIFGHSKKKGIFVHPKNMLWNNFSSICRCSFH